MGWPVGVCKDSWSTNDSSGFLPNYEVGNEASNLLIEVSWFVVSSHYRRVYKVQQKLVVAFWEPCETRLDTPSSHLGLYRRCHNAAGSYRVSAHHKEKPNCPAGKQYL